MYMNWNPWNELTGNEQWEIKHRNPTLANPGAYQWAWTPSGWTKR